MAATRLIAMHQNKGLSIEQCIKNRSDYAKNPEKTDGGQLVSSYKCDPELIEEQFAVTKNEYFKKTGRQHQGDVIAYQIRQAFKPGEIIPEEANRIGYETAMRWTKGNHAFIVATHIDREHIHNHIIYNSTNLDCNRKYRNFFFSGITLQKVSDLVCLENGLSVIEPGQSGERLQRTVYPENRRIRDDIRKAIDICLSKKPKNMDELLKLLQEMGYEIKRGKYISVLGEGQEKFVRLRSLGEGYTDSDLENILSGKSDKKIDMLVDIQSIIANGKGPGYERWAKVYNIKQIAQTLLFLEEQGIRDYDELTEKAKSSFDEFKAIAEKQKALETRLNEISELKKHIINYSKTRDIYVEYRKQGYCKQFFENHRDEITLHKAAKEAFSKIAGKIPKIKELNAEYEQILSIKKKTYSEYRQSKEEMKKYQTAKYNIEKFMKKEDQEKQTEKQKTEEQTI